MTTIATKIYFLPSNLIRRFQINVEQSYEDFDRTVREAFGVLKTENAEYVWQYQDDEEDWVSFSTEREWRDALFFHQQSKTNLLRLRLSQIINRPEPTQFFRRHHHGHHHHHHHDGQVRHFGITCDGCEQHPIVGDRFKCDNLEDFDFCGKCHSSEEMRKKHGAHTFTKIERPVRRCGGRRHWGQNAPLNGVRHWGVRCDGCNQSGIVGDRYKCNDCGDFDFCGNCYNSEKLAQHGHSFTRIAKPIPFGCKTFRDGEDIVVYMPIDSKFPQEELNRVQTNLLEAFGDIVKSVELVAEEPKPQAPAQEEVKAEEPSAPVEEVKVEEPVPEPVVAPSAPVEEKPVERFPEHMHTLREMGFENEALNRHLLNNYSGDITKVVASLLQLTGYRNQ